MAKSKSQRGKNLKSAALQDKQQRMNGGPRDEVADSQQPAGDPLRAFPADPPRKNLPLFIVSAVLFAIWFAFLAYIALATS
jgi:hypothetical protein